MNREDSQQTTAQTRQSDPPPLPTPIPYSGPPARSVASSSMSHASRPVGRQFNFLSRNPSGSQQGQLRMSREERLMVVRYCVDHQNAYRQLSRQHFWANFKLWFQKTYNREVKQPDRLLSRLVKEQRTKQGSMQRERGTDLERALNDWIRILEDIEETKVRGRAAAAVVAEAPRQTLQQTQNGATGEGSKRSQERHEHSAPEQQTSADGQRIAQAPQQQMMESALNSFATAIQTLAVSKESCSREENEQIRADIANLNDQVKEIQGQMSAIAGHLSTMMSTLEKLLREKEETQNKIL
ncbi:hypothetical protein AJ79_07341 [Helicocarpus griseus UAMH5409]|uniref:Uncharacterized protein n=1 Tax=Helicocarpus griseus UAMH5409 TaxID=1447875 RepID=A0A2B7X4E6_9EURO|nr:hypothetical protein AJ79_07341 [Helicocarpus griseus UAMH5409]